VPLASTSNPFREDVDPTSHYAWDVAHGKIVAGLYAKLACQRHLDDLENGPKRGLRWDYEKALHVIEFFPSVLRVTAGSAEGKPFELISYTKFVVGNLFGWYRGDRRRFRKAWIEAGKGQIKSPLAAAIGIYLLAFDGNKRAECYAIAKDRNQANVLFDDAVAMVYADIADGNPGENLIKTARIVPRGTGKMTWALECRDSAGGFCQFRPLAGEEKVSGPRPIYVAADEIHDWKTPGPLQTWEAAGAKMPGNFLLWMSTNTPGIDQLVGSEFSDLFQKILRGDLKDDSAFAYIARTDEKDDPFNDRTCWVKSLPCLGITFPIENVEIQIESAKNSAGARMSALRLYFGVPVGSSEYWVDVDKWSACLKPVNEDDLTDLPCFLAMDLSQKNDLTALGAIWPTEYSAKATIRYWKPAENLDEAISTDRAPYRQWHSDGFLRLTPGRAIDYDFVATEVERMCVRHKVQFMAFDPAHIEEFIKACERIGFDVWVWEPEKPVGKGLKLVVHSQGKEGMHSKKSLWMPRSLGKLEDRVLTGLIDIQENPITGWCAGNVAIKADEKDNRYFVKKHQRGRIDGLTVLAMLCGALDADLSSPKAVDLDDFLRNVVVV
jgi:phage terminase large subunit-like protein